jgi:hypothetical protein
LDLVKPASIRPHLISSHLTPTHLTPTHTPHTTHHKKPQPTTHNPYTQKQCRTDGRKAKRRGSERKLPAAVEATASLDGKKTGTTSGLKFGHVQGTAAVSTGTSHASTCTTAANYSNGLLPAPRSCGMSGSSGRVCARDLAVVSRRSRPRRRRNYVGLWAPGELLGSLCGPG